MQEQSSRKLGRRTGYAAVAGAFLFVLSWLPIWRNWHVSSLENSPRLSNLWSAISNMSQPPAQCGFVSWCFYWHWWNWALALAALALGAFYSWGLLTLNAKSSALRSSE